MLKPVCLSIEHEILINDYLEAIDLYIEDITSTKEKYKPTPDELSRVNLSGKNAKSIDFYRGKPTTANIKKGSIPEPKKK